MTTTNTTRHEASRALVSSTVAKCIAQGRTGFQIQNLDIEELAEDLGHRPDLLDLDDYEKTILAGIRLVRRLEASAA